MTKYFLKFKKSYFWLISPIFGAKKVIPQNQVVMHNFKRVSGTMTKFRKMIQFQENIQTDVRKKGWTDPIS